MSKKKLWVSITSLALVAVIGIASVFVILASLSASINSSFNIYYTAKNINGCIIGSWYQGEVVSDNPTPLSQKGSFTSGGKEYIEFNKQNELTQGSFDAINVDLLMDYTGDTEGTKDIQKLYTYFLVANFDDSPMPVNISYNETQENMTTSIYAANTDFKQGLSLIRNIETNGCQLELPSSGVSSAEDLIKKFELSALSIFYAAPILSLVIGAGPLYHVISYEYQDFLEIYNTLRTHINSHQNLYNDTLTENWTEAFSYLVSDITDMPANEDTFNYFKAAVQESFSREMTLSYSIYTSAYLLIAVINNEEALQQLIENIILPPVFLVMMSTHSVTDDIKDASLNGNFDFTLGLV